jgi:hypothetical protein
MRDLFGDDPGRTPRATIGGQKRPPKVHTTWMDAADAVASQLHGARRTGAWTYADTHGDPAMVVVRYDLMDGSKEFHPISPCPGGWRIGQPKGLIPLYDMPTVASNVGEAVYVVEGEKCAEALGKYMPCVTTSPFGAGKAHK